jgi:hypothetical protein
LRVGVVGKDRCEKQDAEGAEPGETYLHRFPLRRADNQQLKLLSR